MSEPFCAEDSACSGTVSRTAQENEETPHQAEVQGWSHFISEETAVQHAALLPLLTCVRVIQTEYITSVLMDLLSCVEKPRPLCLCTNNKLSGQTGLRAGEPRTHGGEKNQTDQQVDVPRGRFHTHSPADGRQRRLITCCLYSSALRRCTCTPVPQMSARWPPGRGTSRPPAAP